MFIDDKEEEDMSQVLKVLNNNTILVSEKQSEIIIMYKGIGFGKKIDDELEIPSSAKRYVMQKGNSDTRKVSDIINTIDPEYIEVASEILRLATEKFGDVDEGILLPLADHICFAIKRIDEKIMPSNPFLNDIRLLFPDEYQVASKGKEVIKHIISKEINDDEVGYITLHIHSAISSNPVSDSMEATRIIHDSIHKLQQDLHITIDVHSISYVRLMNHIKFLLLRLNTDEPLQMDISEFTKDKFPYAYEEAKTICESLSNVLSKQVPENEIGYLALHLERILSNIT